MARYWSSRPQQFVSQFVPRNLELEQGYFDDLQKRQDIAQAEVAALNKSFEYINTPEESALATQTKKKIEQEAMALRDLDVNSPQGKQKLVEGIKKLRSYYEPGGQAYAHEANLKAYKENVKYLDELLKKGPGENGIDERAYNYFKDKAMKDFNNTGIVTPEGYKQYTPITPALNPDIDKQVIEATRDWKSNAESKGYWQDSTGQWKRKTTKGIEYIDPNEVRQAVLADVMARPENIAYANQQAEIAFFGKDDTQGYDEAGNPISYRPGYQKQKVAMNILTQPVELAAARLGFTKETYDEDIKEDSVRAKRMMDEVEEAKKQAWETTYSQMGEQGVNNLAKVAEAEPSNSILAKIFNFVNPSNQAKGLLNFMKLFTPSMAENPAIAKISSELEKDAKLSEDQINKNIETITYGMKQEVAKDQKSFRDTFGFGNPMFDQAYTILDTFGKGSTPNTNKDYERAKAVVSSRDPEFNKLTEREKFDRVKEEMGKFVESSKTNVILVPMDKKELDFKNQQIANLTGTPTDKTRQLTNMGLTANGRFVDYYTGKETTLEDIVGETGQLKYMGELENDNQFGPGMNYFQGANGKFYVSPGALDNQKANFINWNLKQINNKFSQAYEFPLLFENRRDVKADGSIPEGIPKASVTRDLKTGKLKASVSLSGSEEINIEANNEDEIKIGIAKNLFDKGFTIEQIKQLGL